MLQNVVFIMKASIASGTIYFGGDVTAQLLVENKDTVDVERALKFSAIGFVWAGPFCRIGMNRINQISNKWYTKTAIDQSLMMPVNMAIVNVLKPLFEGDKTIGEISEIWMKKYPEVLAKGWLYWIPTTMIIYAFITQETMRFVAFNIAAYIWQVNLAMLVNKTTEKNTESEPEVDWKSDRSKRRYSITSVNVSSLLC